MNDGQRRFRSYLNVGGWLVILAMIWFAIFGVNGFVDLFKLHRSKRELEVKVAEIERKNQALRDEIKALNADDNREVERIARKDFGMVGDDEIMYQFKGDQEKTDSKQYKENQQKLNRD